MSFNINEPSGMTFICIHCLYPTRCRNSSKLPGEEDDGCGRLYKRFGNDTIKLSDCSRCHNYIDEYCEREWLLVILDLILFRPQAFRHVLFNRWKQQEQEQQEHALIRACVPGQTLLPGVPNILPYLSISSALLRAHVGVVATQDRVTIEQTLFAMLQFVPLAGMSWLGYILQILVVEIGIIGIVRSTTRGSSDRDAWWRRRIFSMSDNRELLIETSLAILLPTTLIYGLTAFVFLWEISETILGLATGLIVAYQWMAVWTIVQQKQSTAAHIHDPHENLSPNSIRWLSYFRIVTVVLMLGSSIAMRALVMEWMAWMVFPHSQMPCPGWTWILYSNQRLCLAG
jgi:hypothetical protein